MRPRGWTIRKRGRFARAFVFGLGLLAGGCASAPKGSIVAVQPGPQQQRTHQVVGDAIIASLGGVTVTVRWLGAQGVERFFEARPGLVYPWPKEVWQEAPPTIFLLQIRNPTRDEVQFDPGLVAVVTQGGQRERLMPYEDMYMRLAGEEGSGPRLLSLQAALFSRFVVISPGGQREGLLVFPTLDDKARHLLLELSSFFVGGRMTPGLFEFQVLRE
ncbi:MAG TPA: hypothetical protein VLT62_05600 [Candidatus Methylomirabilis sp.]|nr:hypothetical protein [Candidatus Methylomirabilis sp.]